MLSVIAIAIACVIAIIGYLIKDKIMYTVGLIFMYSSIFFVITFLVTTLVILPQIQTYMTNYVNLLYSSMR